MTVPAVARARNLIANTIAGDAPQVLRRQRDDRRVAASCRACHGCEQLEPDTPRSTTLAYLVDSMLFFGRGYLRVREVYEEDGRPRSFEWVDPAFVTFDVDLDTGLDHPLLLQPQPGPDVRRRLPRRLPRSRRRPPRPRRRRPSGPASSSSVPPATSPGPPRPPSPSRTTASTCRPTRSSRSSPGGATPAGNSAVGYLSSALSIDTHGFSPADLALVDARRFQVLEVARLTGIPAGTSAPTSARR